MLELDWGQIVNAGAGMVSLYLATQIRLVVRNHETRIVALEVKPKAKPKPRRAR